MTNMIKNMAIIANTQEQKLIKNDLIYLISLGLSKLGAILRKKNVILQ